MVEKLKKTEALWTLKSKIKSDPFLYRIWFYLNKHRLSELLKLPNKNDHYYFDGYPRSGNTYFQGLLKFIFPELQGTSHLHTVAGLKIAKEKGIKTFITIRNPKNAVVSNLYTKIKTHDLNFDNYDQLIERLLQDWINYYEYARFQCIKFIVFEKVIKDKKLYIETIIEYLNLLELENEAMKNKINLFESHMRDLEEKKETHASSLPDSKRDDFKLKYYRKVEKAGNFSIAKELYLRITDEQI